MELRDLIVTPILIIVVLVIAYVIRPYVTDEITRRYFFPALLLRVFCAIALGFLYQYYYSGGDTFNYHTHGSRQIWEAFVESPLQGLKLLFYQNEIPRGTFKYASQILFLNEPSSFFVVRVAAIFDLLTFSTYSATAVLFAVASFVGMWMFFLAFYKRFPHLHKWIAVAAFFIPSVFFWGSGLLKDTLTLTCLGIATYEIAEIFISRRFSIRKGILLLLSLAVIFIVKKYILLCYVPSVFLWIYALYFSEIRSTLIRVMFVPLVVMITIASGYFAVMRIGADDPRYSFNNLAKTAKITAYDIGFYTGRDAGSGYSLGELDGTFTSLFRVAPQAVNVTLFRPYLWEVKNILILLSSLESLCVLVVTLIVLFRARWNFFRAMSDPYVLFCLVFAITFAFAVGVSTFNFGTLMRYKIPMLPFYIMALAFISDYSKRERKLEALDSTE